MIDYMKASKKLRQYEKLIFEIIHVMRIFKWQFFISIIVLRINKLRSPLCHSVLANFVCTSRYNSPICNVLRSAYKTQRNYEIQ